MGKFSWDDEAHRLAAYVSENMHEAHRGVMRYSDGGLLIVFGNDGYFDEKTQRQCGVFTGFVRAVGGEVLGFGVEPSGYSWAMVVSGVEQDGARAMLWSAWAQAHRVDGDDNDLIELVATQAGIAEGVIDQQQPKPESMN